MSYSLILSSERAPPFHRPFKYELNVLIQSPIQTPSPQGNFQPAFNQNFSKIELDYEANFLSKSRIHCNFLRKRWNQ